MDKNKIALEILKDKLLGLKSCYIGVGYGGYLKLGVGEKIFYKDNELKGKYHGEWDIVSRQCTWRIRKEGILLCGDGDEIEYSRERLHSLVLGVVDSVIQKELFDFSIIFDNGIIIDYFMNTTYEPQLHIINNLYLAYELTEEGLIEIDPRDLYKKSTELDSVLNVYSDECCKRWSKLVDKANSENICDDCFYFRSINGSFYNWEFGICSNCESEFDGKLVGNESGCDKFKQLKDLIK